MSALADPTSERPAPRPASQGEPLLRLRGIGKNFGPVQALVGVDLDVPSGQVTAPRRRQRRRQVGADQVHLGDPRARPGSDLLGGPTRSTSGRLATRRRLGIETVYQDLALCDNLDIVQNMFLGRERTKRDIARRGGHGDRGARDARRASRVTTVRSIRQPVASLSGGQRQSVAIAKAVLWNTKLVIMDEPTAALGVAQTAMVLDLVRTARRPRTRGASSSPTT